LEQREIRHPKEIKVLVVLEQLLHLSNPQSQTSEHFAGDLPFVGTEQNQIAFFNLEFRLQRHFLGLAEEFDDRRFPFAALDLDEGEPFRAECLCDFSKLIALADRKQSK